MTPKIQLGDFLVLITNAKGADAAEWDRITNLIAAAPELLKQLKALVVQIEHSHLIVPPGVRAAIDKAEGR
jgi:hypothetical protein